ncbi:protransforming growth factor alpha [Kryptolebias marmoratus]|uniref:EGF-like domain-containing protein n=1 Tax=Kryptolebias marmoratus TaxID=37003 RepID=A0A3Q2ZU98_KRYMA|nr:protransforming growth factor alpha [Kryptolebias marmoratus]
MLTQRQTHLEKALLPTVTMLLLLLTTAGQPAEAAKISPTAAADPDSSLMTPLISNNTDTYETHSLHIPCGSEHSTYCFHEGKCVHPRDNISNLSCICKESYQGTRCEIYSNFSSVSAFQKDQVVGIMIGIVTGVLLVSFLAMLISCFAYRRCRKSAPLIKLASSEALV